jgi:FkbM family methyltransferase
MGLFGNWTYSQHGEDITFCQIFDRLGMHHPSYLDVGAFHPLWISNTALLYERGSRGINVEPNAALIDLFKQYRPYDLNLCCAVGAKRGKRSLWVGENPGMSSFYRDIVSCPVEAEITVDVWTVSDILIGHRHGQWTDLFSIDIEGADIEVLAESLPPAGDRPTVVCVEAIAQGIDSSFALRPLMVAKRYFLHSWARANMLWVKDEVREALL